MYVKEKYSSVQARTEQVGIKQDFGRYVSSEKVGPFGGRAIRFIGARGTSPSDKA